MDKNGSKDKRMEEVDDWLKYADMDFNTAKASVRQVAEIVKWAKGIIS